MDLKQGLAWLTTAGAGIVAYWLLEKVKGLKALDAEPKRYTALALSGAIALLAWGGMILMEYRLPPETWRSGVEQAFGIVFASFGVSQIVHARRDLAR